MLSSRSDNAVVKLSQFGTATSDASDDHTRRVTLGTVRVMQQCPFLEHWQPSIGNLQ